MKYDLEGVCQDCIYLDKIKPLFDNFKKENQELKIKNVFLMQRDNKCQILEQENQKLKDELSSKSLQLEKLKKQEEKNERRKCW